MSKSETIKLKNLVVLDVSRGRVSTKPLSVQKPTPCNQTNAKGNLRSHADLKAFRTAAWETGVRFKMGFGL